jgi:hypothetical protein
MWEDEKIVALVGEYGLEGYGFWCRLLDIVAYQMDGSEKCWAEYTLSQWANLFSCHHHKVSNYLSKMEVAGLVTLRYNEGKTRGNTCSKIEVTISNLLKYRDEYSRKSGQKS